MDSLKACSDILIRSIRFVSVYTIITHTLLTLLTFSIMRGFEALMSLILMNSLAFSKWSYSWETPRFFLILPYPSAILLRFLDSFLR
jgi:hypothetical protein